MPMGADAYKISEAIAHVQELARLLCGDANGRFRGNARIFGWPARERRARHLGNSASALIDLKHGDVIGGCVDHENEAAERIDGHRAAMEAIWKR
jgi:hypothetical protein